jgi:serine/threonine-protein kinase HipA
MTQRSLRAWINESEVGTLSDQAGIWCFQYAPAWLQNPGAFALSPKLPLQPDLLIDGSTTRPVQWYFDNLLPEEGQRTLLAADADIDAADAFGLLGWYGAESAGSITLLAPDVPPHLDGALRALPDQALQARIDRMPKVPLTQGAIKRMSLAGAQHKLAVVLEGGDLFEPRGATPSTHILKPDHPDEDYPHSVINEWFTMALARRVGLDVPRVHRRYVPAPVYIIDRFDRVCHDQAWQRTHAIDACQLLGLDRSFKYREGSIQRLSELANACRSPAAARTKLFSWMVFNVLVGNSDAHLKNLSFLVSQEGVQLAPFYDLLSVAVYDSPACDKVVWPDQTQLAWPILGVDRFCRVSKALLLDAASQMGIGKSTAERIMAALCAKTWEQAQVLYQIVESDNAALSQARAELSATLAGEGRSLRAIIHVVIKEMTQLLR